MAWKKIEKFEILRAINQPSAAHLREYHIVMVGDIAVSNLHHDEFFALGDEMKSARESNTVLRTGWFEARWKYPEGDSDNAKVKALKIDTFQVLSKIDNSGNAIGPKVDAPSPPFTTDSPGVIIESSK